MGRDREEINEIVYTAPKKETKKKKLKPGLLVEMAGYIFGDENCRWCPKYLVMLERKDLIK